MAEGGVPSLHVEGDDDLHTVFHLLARHVLNGDPNPSMRRINRPGGRRIIEVVFGDFRMEIHAVGGVEAVLDGMETAIRLSSPHPIGFVLDADSPLADRWRDVGDRLREAEIDLPDSPPPGGFIGLSRSDNTRVGVWLMPDNQQSGMLEDFLQTLIADEDSLIEFARTATTEAKQTHGATFPDAHEAKAQIRAWLAWQEKPGLPFGTAIRERFFRDDSLVASVFVSWFKRLYRIG